MKTVVAILLWFVTAGGALAVEGAPYTAEDHGPAWQHWALNCQGCHRPDASGSLGGAPKMTGFVAKFLGVPGGREYLMRVPGVATSGLSSAQLAEVLNWLVRRFDAAHVPGDFTPYTEAELAAARQHPYRTDAPVARAALIAKMAP